MKLIKSLFLISLSGLSGCTVLLPDVKVCAVAGVLSAGADCAQTGSDKTEDISLDGFIEFLEPQIDPPRGAAICMSSEDFARLKTAMEQACNKLGAACKKEVKENLAKVTTRFDGLQERVREKKRRHKNQTKGT